MSFRLIFLWPGPPPAKVAPVIEFSIHYSTTIYSSALLLRRMRSSTIVYILLLALYSLTIAKSIADYKPGFLAKTFSIGSKSLQTMFSND